MNESNGVIRDARKLGIPKMLILGLQHMFAMFGATILVPILVNSYFVDACGEGPSRGLPYPSHCSAPALERCCSICARNLKYRHFLVLRLHS